MYPDVSCVYHLEYCILYSVCILCILCVSCQCESLYSDQDCSDASCGCGSLVWIHCDASHIQIASKAARLSCFAAHVTHVKTGEKELHGSAGKQSGAVRGLLLCLPGLPIGPLCSHEYRLAVSCRVSRSVP